GAVSTSSPSGPCSKEHHMTGSSVSAVTAYTAHREWASRPPDERYASVHALYEAARARHARIEERTIETGEFRTEAIDTDDLVDPTDRTHAGLFRGFILRNSDVGAAALTLDVFLFRLVCGNHIIWGFQHVAGFRRRHVGASIQDAWTTSLDCVRAALDADIANDRTRLLRAMSQELGPTRDAVLDTAVQRLDVSQKQATEAYTLAEQFETNPRSVWGYVQGLTRLSQRTPWQD